MIVDNLKNSILLSAISGKLSVQSNSELITFDVKNYFDDLEFTIPKNWKAVKLGDISDYGKNESISGKDINDDEWILELEDIEKETGIIFKKIYQKERKSVSNKNRFYKGNLLYGKLRPYLNKCVIASDDGYCSTEIVPMNLDVHIINKYLQLVLMSPYYLNYVNKKSYGTKMPRLGTKDAQNSIIPLPPLEEQQRIIEKVEDLFYKLEKIKSIEKELKTIKGNFSTEMKISILKYFYNENGGLVNKENLKNETLFNVCDGEIYTGNSISENTKKIKYTGIKDGYNYIATKDLQFNHSFNYENGVKIPFEEKKFKYANKNDILMCIEGGSAGKKIGILEEKVCYGNKLCKFSPKMVEPKYLYYYLQSPQFLNNFNDSMTGIIGGVSINKIKKIEIKYPSLEEQKRMIEKLEQLLPLCDDIQKLIKN